MAVDVVFTGAWGAVCLFFAEVGTGVCEDRDGWGVVLGGQKWRIEEEDVVGAQAFVEPVYGMKVHEAAGDGVCESDAVG